MDLFDLLWNESITFGEKLQTLTNLKLEYDNKITNRKLLSFDIYYDFAKDFNSIKSDNQKWKQITLALYVLRVTRKWERKYIIDLKKTASGDLFIGFFKDNIDVSKHFLCENGINFYVNEKYTYKTFVIWAYKLNKLGVISDALYNEFMKLLERKSKYGQQ